MIRPIQIAAADHSFDSGELGQGKSWFMKATIQVTR